MKQNLLLNEWEKKSSNDFFLLAGVLIRYMTRNNKLAVLFTSMFCLEDTHLNDEGQILINILLLSSGKFYFTEFRYRLGKEAPISHFMENDSSY